MLSELNIENLGIIKSTTLRFDGGLTVFTGETGAGKTMLVEAIDLVVGGRADPGMVGAHGTEARVEGRFLRRRTAADGEVTEVILTRVVPADGRSRAYVDGRLATAAQLAEIASELVDIHGQNAHQSLLSMSSQRTALDAHAGVDLSEVRATLEELAAIDDALASTGGDPRERAREMDLLSFQVREIEAAAIASADEDEALEVEEDRLASITAVREALMSLARRFDDEGPVNELRTGLREIAPHSSLAAIASRLAAVLTELEDLGHEVRRCADEAEEDPERLAAVRQRRQMLRELRRKYGESLVAVAEFGRRAAQRLTDLESWNERAEGLVARRREALERLVAAQQIVGDLRRSTAPRLAEEVERRLRELGMPHASLRVQVSEEPLGNEVTFLLAANPGSTHQPLAKVASGGELARTMLALRLVLMGVPSVLVFDEVDAGIGGAAAVAVGRALAALGRSHQVFAVTHLPQVAAAASTQVLVEKTVAAGSTTGTARVLVGEERATEVARMLSGGLADGVAREHAASLLREFEQTG